MKHYSVTRKKDILPFVTAWKDLEGVVPTETSQRKTSTVWYHFYVESRKAWGCGSGSGTGRK